MPRNEIGLSVEITRAAEHLRELLKKQPWFSGFYGLHLEPMGRLREELPRAAEEFLCYAKKTAGLESATELRLRNRWSIRKYHNQASEVGYSYATSPASWDGEVRSELDVLIRQRLEAKRQMAVRFPGKLVLVLLDRYQVAPLTMWAELVSSIDASVFRAVIRVDHTAECVLLHGAI
ncbi:MAG: hypothetical protein L0387_25670 [Acidobacteria bacterium]|nr:hypothetical protein [Acidobacteriota bacterium]MCI0624988.1 hypothetical protein [Acidobacteriota bacterium]MCI0717900.1 hypothetical protein [Acidobacteriota bacterium]